MPRFGCGQTNVAPYVGMKCITDDQIRLIVDYLGTLK
jgi:hypothetical protein